MSKVWWIHFFSPFSHHWVVQLTNTIHELHISKSMFHEIHAQTEYFLLCHQWSRGIKIFGFSQIYWNCSNYHYVTLLTGLESDYNSDWQIVPVSSCTCSTVPYLIHEGISSDHGVGERCACLTIYSNPKCHLTPHFVRN